MSRDGGSTSESELAARLTDAEDTIEAQRERIHTLETELRETNEGLVELTLERDERERTLTALHTATQRIQTATTTEGVYERAVDAARDALNLPRAVCWRHEDEPDGGILRPVTGTEPAMADEPKTFTTDDYECTVFLERAPTAHSVSEHRPDHPLERRLLFPLGEHGLLGAGRPGVDRYEEYVFDAGRILASHVTAALDRAADEARRRRRETQLETLTQATGDLLEAQTPGEVCDAVVETAEADLGLPMALIALHDDETGTLRSRSGTDLAETVVDEAALLREESGIAWEAFVKNRTAVGTDLAVGGTIEEVNTEEADVGVVDARGVDAETYSVAVLPIGAHGVFVVGSLAASVGDDGDDGNVTLARILGANTQPALVQLLVNNTESSLDRADREQQLVERESLMREQNERLERLNRVNDVIRRIDQELVAAETRSEIERAVCTQLMTVDPYAFAWIGAYDIVEDGVEPQAWAGGEDGFLDAVSILDANADELGPTGQVVETRTPRVVDDLLGDPPFPTWRQEALSRGYRACIALPLQHRDVLYGVLTVYADAAGTFDEMERTVLAELAETIAFTITVTETRRGVLTEGGTELEVRIPEPDTFLNTVAGVAGQSVTCLEVTPKPPDTAHLLFALEDAPSEAILALESDLVAVEEIRHVSGEDRDVFRAEVTSSTTASAVVEYGAVPREIETTVDETIVVAALPEHLDVRVFVERLRERYPETELVARRDRDQHTRTHGEFVDELEDALTDRQLEVLRTAFEGGYFEWPRESTGEDVADLLGVSQPTINRHLRESQRRLFTLLFGDRETDDSDEPGSRE